MSSWAVTAFVLGLLSSAHCLGMCGPLALAVPSPKGHALARLGSALLLNGGRLFTYMALGAAAGLFGRGLHMAGAQRTVSITLGILILVGLFLPGLLARIPFAQGPARLAMRLQGVFARQLHRTSPEGLLVTGMINGLLPCGMVYLALAGAISQDGWMSGAGFMLVFGLGTWPALVTLKVSSTYLAPGLRATLRRFTPVAYAAMGILFILRGLDLGIPYISPDLPEANTTVQECAPGEVPE
jgi:sulfite exporter TauE/SafE